MIISSLIKKNKEQAKLPIQLVCPYINEVPEDDLLRYISVQKPSDLFAERKSNDVLMFSADKLDLLRVWNLNQETFGLSILSLTDVPGVVYDAEFEDATSRGSKVAYHSLIGDLTEAGRRSEMVRDATMFDKEQRAITRKSGEVKRIEEDDFDQSED